MSMYHKMPLFRGKKKKISRKDCIILFFSGLSFTNLSKRKHALSSIWQKKNVEHGASYDTYSGASITLEMVVIMPLFICFMKLPYIFIF